MLGDKIGDLQGQVTSTRVLSTDTGPEVEVSFAGQGNLLGVDTNDIGTYLAQARPDGTLYGEGQGISLTADGEAISWKGHGVGIPTGEGMGAKWRGAVYYFAPSEELARLNQVAAVYEFDVAADGTVTGSSFEWK